MWGLNAYAVMYAVRAFTLTPFSVWGNLSRNWHSWSARAIATLLARDIVRQDEELII